MINTIRAYRFLAILIGAAALSSPVWADPPSQVGRISYLSGDVSFQSGSLDEWGPATLNYPLTAGDNLWTDVGARAEVRVLSAALRLDSGTDFSFVNLDDQVVQVRLASGSLSVTLHGLDAGDIFEVDTPDAIVTMREPGNYRIDVRSDGTDVTVRKGSADVTAGSDDFDVPAGRFASISGGESFAYYVAGLPAPDEWDDWCQTRDQREVRFASYRYVPREMIGAEDLDENGTWFVEAGYGTVWAPSHVPSGWAPYRFGRWGWVEPWGWTWIDDAPWGFAPFHYGRWAFHGARWVWIPGAMVKRPVYAPALVVFIGGNGWRPDPREGEGIGWFPLGPREVYIPPYQTSTTYVQRINITHVTNITVQNIQRINVNQVVYVNRTVPRALTFVPHDVFVNSRPAAAAMLSVSTAEIRQAPLMGMTARVAPQRESVIVQPLAPRTPVAQPSAELASRRVYSRTAPPPPPVSFTTRQQALTVNPGRPVDPGALQRLQRAQPTVTPKVTQVNPSTVRRVEPPKAVGNGRQTPVPVVKQPAVTSAPVEQQPNIRPAPVEQQPNVRPAPVERQPNIKPAPVERQPNIKPAPVERQPNIKPAPVERQPNIKPAPVERQPAVKPAPVEQQPNVKPAPVERQPNVKPAPMTKEPAANAPANQGNSKVSAQINAIKTRTLPDADRQLAAARGVAGIRLDFNAVAQQLSAARASLSSAERDLAGGNASQAQQEVAAAQKQIEDQIRLISAAVKAAKK